MIPTLFGALVAGIAILLLWRSSVLDMLRMTLLFSLMGGSAAVILTSLGGSTIQPAILALGYFGSYSRGDWGFGSDLDVVAVLERCTESFERRRLQPQYLDYLPVPADLLIYSQSEFAELPLGSPHFARVMLEETTWLFGEEHARELLQTVTAP